MKQSHEKPLTLFNANNTKVLSAYSLNNSKGLPGQTAVFNSASQLLMPTCIY